jgi:hypothetical protein
MVERRIRGVVSPPTGAFASKKIKGDIVIPELGWIYEQAER